MAYNEELDHYIGVGETEEERLLDADLQDVLDDMTMDHLEGMAEYLLAMADPDRSFEAGEEPHDEPAYVEARTKLGRLMIWQGWVPAAYTRGRVKAA